MTRKTVQGRSRVLERLEGESGQDVRDRAGEHAESQASLRRAQDWADALLASTRGHENDLRERLTAPRSEVNPESLRLWHAVIEQGRRDHAEAQDGVQRAELEFEARREALLGALDRRGRLKELVRQQSLADRREDARKWEAEFDELWLLKRVQR